MIKTIDLFAGIGGIRLGFERAFGKDIETVFVSEFNKYAVKTYSSNFITPSSGIDSDDLMPMCSSPFIYGDIKDIEAKYIPKFDIALAGFPCQAFSYAGKKRGFSDDYKGMTRGTLFREVVRICDCHKPSVIFCENVKGLLSHDKGRTFDIIRGAFNEIGYDVFYKVLNSKNFGVPQNRERIYIVAFRKDISPSEFEFPDGDDSSKTISDILEDAPIDARYYVSASYLKSMEERTARNKAAGNGFGHVIRSLDGVSGTIVCGGMGRERNLICDSRPHSNIPTTNIKGGINDRDIRFMTPREWARLQGFPDDFVFPVSISQQYKQLGNSVTVPVIEAIARKIKETIDF